MTTKKIIDGLYFTVGMILFNPATGESKTPDELNEDDRYTYDACMGAIELLKAQEPRVDGKSQEVISGFTLYCPNCGFANKFANSHWWTTISPWENTVFYCGKCGTKMEAKNE